MWKYGRINRATYTLGLGTVIVLYALMVAFLAKPPGVGEVLAAFLTIPRLHDIGKSGWWFGAGIAGELAAVGTGVVIATRTGNDQAILVAGGLYVIFALGLMIWLGCIKGDPQANRYGEPPAPGLSWKRAA